jgi:hypothetical protein
VSARAELAPDAAMVLGIAATAMPFARTRQEEAERWLRVLRLHGDVGATLQALGVSEGALQVSGDMDRERSAGFGGGERHEGTAGERPASADAGDGESADAGDGESADAGERAASDGGKRDVVARVSERAAERAAGRGAAGVTTTDVLVAVMEVYGANFDAVLRAHGTDRDEVLERLGGEATSS